MQEWDYNSIIFGETVDNMIKFSPRKYTLQTERFCPHCNNPQTRVNQLKGIKKHFNKNITKYKFLLNHLKENNLKVFTIKELIKSLNAENLTDGNLQQKQLSVLIVLGFISKQNEEWIDKKGLKKFRYIFTLNEKVSPPECYDNINDKHRNVDWIRKTYFDKKINKNKDDTSTT